MQLKCVSIDISSVFDLVSVWLEFFEIRPLEVQSFLELRIVRKSFRFTIHKISEHVRCLLGISNFSMLHFDYLLVLDDEQIGGDIWNLFVIQK